MVQPWEEEFFWAQRQELCGTGKDKVCVVRCSNCGCYEKVCAAELGDPCVLTAIRSRGCVAALEVPRRAHPRRGSVSATAQLCKSTEGD